MTENVALDSTSPRMAMEFMTSVTVGKGKQPGWQLAWGVLIAGSAFAVVVALLKGRLQAVHGLIICLWIPLFVQKCRQAGIDQRERVGVAARLECQGLHGWRLVVGEMVYHGTSPECCSITEDGYLLFDAGTEWVKVPVDVGSAYALRELIAGGVK